MKTALIATMFCLVGCTEHKESAHKFEKAVVIQLAYVPATTGRTSGGMGMSSSGKAVVTFGESVTTPEVWATVFRCEQHNKTFSLGGKDVYQSVVTGQTVWLEYVDIIEVDGDGHETVVDQQTKTVWVKEPPHAH